MAKKTLDGNAIATIERLAGLGITLDDIAHCLGTSSRTLDRRLADTPEATAAYARGRAIAKSNMSERLWSIAHQNDDYRSAVTAAIFWLKAQAGWKDRPEEEKEAATSQVVFYLPDNGR